MTDDGGSGGPRTAALTVLGTCFVLGGFVASVERGIAAALWINVVVVTTIGFGTVLLGFKLATTRLRRERDLGEPPVVESVQALSVPGEAFDDQLRKSAEIGRHDVQRIRSRLEERLERIAVATVMRRDGCSRETARERVYSGEWTDDPHAAAFFDLGGDREAELRAVLETRSLEPIRNRYRFQARRLAEAIATASEEAQR